ncbi:hypothetical protein CANMA_003207 [Candida margitis]|uniref:uncharacterized protein n=1 Tax=Candida margitis TaxID=1775924 RepID=UPI0022272C59|nr:uncharacterized protein CANMA_003207 [Candida margitis]KAI5967150.1 hypothetical protein CANMA_003207 [Candida margitis]
MDYFKKAYHDVRFNFDHFIVDYKRKYYSLNQNPRVLRTRVPNQPFTSLRTYEYCPSVPVFDVADTASVVLGDEDKENVPEAWIRTADINLFPSFDACFDQCSSEMQPPRVFSESNLNIVGYDCLETFSLDMNVGSSTSPVKNEDEAMTHDDDEESTDYNDSYSGMQYVSPFHLVYPTPSSDETEVKKSNRLSRLVRSLSNVGSRGYDKVEQSMPCVNLATPEMDNQEIKAASPKPHRRPPAPENQPSNQIWKMVLNDASLSAARISTGNSTSAVVTNQYIKGDFTDAKVSPATSTPKDIFAEHLEQAKLKYSPKSSLV